MEAPQNILCLIMYEMTYEYRLHVLAKSLASWGHQVVVLARKGNPSQEKRPYRLCEVRIKRSRPASGHLGRLLRMIEFYLKFLAASWNNSSKCDIVLVSDVMMLPIGWIISRLRGARLIYDMRELWPWTKNHGLKFWRMIDQAFIGTTDAWIVVNKLRADFIQSQYHPPKPAWILHPYPEKAPATKNAILKDFCASRGCPTDFVALYKGGLLPGNNIEILIDAAASFDPSIVLVILGFAASESYYESLTSRAAVLPHQNIIFHPPVPAGQVFQFVQGADVGFVTYTADCINSDLCEPCKLYDFMMAGVPTIVSRVQGTEQVIKETGAGILVYFTPDEVSAAVNLLYRDARKCMDMQRRAIEASQQHFNWEAQEPTLQRLISSLSRSSLMPSDM